MLVLGSYRAAVGKNDAVDGIFALGNRLDRDADHLNAAIDLHRNAVAHDAAGMAAVLFTVSGCASLLTGGLYGLRHPRTPPRVQLVAASAGLAIGCLPMPLARSPVELGSGVALTGLAIPLILVLCSLLAEGAVHRAVLSQAFAWLNSASAAGSASAAAGAGWAVDTVGARGGLAVAATAASVMAVLAVAGLRALREPRRLPATPAGGPSTSSGQQPRRAGPSDRTAPGR